MTHNAHFVEREHCPVCKSKRSRTLYRCDLLEPKLWGFLTRYYARGHLTREWVEGTEYRLDQCLDCTLIFQRYIGNDAFMTELYDRWLNSEYHPDEDPLVRHAMAHPAQYRDGHELFAIAHMLGRPARGLRVLDYGLGWGVWARVARRLGAEVYGFDLSAQRQEFARAHDIRVVEREELPGLELDFINTEQVFEHLTHPFEDASVLSSALRPGGLLKIAVPQAPFLEQRLGAMDWDAGRDSPLSLNAVHPLEHVNCYTKRAIRTLGRRVGLSLVKIDLASYFSFVRESDAIHWSSPLQVVKAALRPAYHRLSHSNQYRIFRKVGPTETPA